MEKYRYHKEWEDKCRYNLYLESCARCLFQNLCLFEYNQERLWNDIHDQRKIIEKNK